jgi:hypothetical protein
LRNRHKPAIPSLTVDCFFDINRRRQWIVQNAEVKEHTKNGIVKGRQDGKDINANTALEICLKGVGFSGIGRILKVHHTTVLNWIKKIGQSVEMPVSGEPVITAELGEIHTYVKKNYRWGWIAVD